MDGSSGARADGPTGEASAWPKHLAPLFDVRRAAPIHSPRARAAAAPKPPPRPSRRARAAAPPRPSRRAAPPPRPRCRPRLPPLPDAARVPCGAPQGYVRQRTAKTQAELQRLETALQLV